MAHFAQIDNNNIVVQVIVVDNQNLIDANGGESEATGIAYIESILGTDMSWVQTSYNGNFRNKYAGIGYYYDQQKDAFISPQPFESWTLDSSGLNWIPPVPYPEDGNVYQWNEKVGYWETYI